MGCFLRNFDRFDGIVSVKPNMIADVRTRPIFNGLYEISGYISGAILLNRADQETRLSLTFSKKSLPALNLAHLERANESGVSFSFAKS